MFVFRVAIASHSHRVLISVFVANRRWANRRIRRERIAFCAYIFAHCRDSPVAALCWAKIANLSEYCTCDWWPNGCVCWLHSVDVRYWLDCVTNIASTEWHHLDAQSRRRSPNRCWLRANIWVYSRRLLLCSAHAGRWFEPQHGSMWTDSTWRNHWSVSVRATEWSAVWWEWGSEAPGDWSGTALLPEWKSLRSSMRPRTELAAAICIPPGKI